MSAFPRKRAFIDALHLSNSSVQRADIYGLYFALILSGSNPYRIFIVRRIFRKSLRSCLKECTCSTSSCSPLASAFSWSRSATPTPATGSREARHDFRLFARRIVTAGLMVYLVYALLTPEKF